MFLGDGVFTLKFKQSFYGTEARILGMMYQRNRIYLSILKSIAKGMGGHVSDEYRELIMQHASDAADTIIKDEEVIVYH